MFDLGWQEILIIATVTLIVVGPKDLPKLFNRAGRIVGNIKQISKEFFDKVNEAAEVDEINDLKSSMNDLTDIGSFEENEILGVEKPKEPIEKKSVKKNIKAKTKEKIEKKSQI